MGDRRGSQGRVLGSLPESDLDSAMEGLFHPERQGSFPEGARAREDREGQGYYRSGSHSEPPEDQDREDRVETTRRTSVHDDSSTAGHSGHDFAHNHPIMSKLKSSGHSVKKKSRKVSESVKETLEGIQESEGPLPLEDLEGEGREAEGEAGEDAPSSLPWKRGGEGAAVPAGFGAEIPRFDAVLDSSRGREEELGVDGPGGEEDEGEAEARRGGVVFQIGGDEEAEEDPGEQKKKHKRSSHHRAPQAMSERYRQGSDLHDKLRRPVTPEEEPAVTELDRDDIGTRRFEKQKGLMMHKIDRAKDRVIQEQVPSGPGLVGSAGHYGHRDTLDHTPHELFVEMDELEGEAWVERARWIKYEEDLEADRGQWGKPHVASLSFSSLVSLRRCLEQGVLLLDITVRDLPELLHRVVEDLSEKAIIEEDQKAKVLGVLLYRHKHVHPHNNTFKFGLKRSLSQRSIQGLLEDRRASMTTEKHEDKNHLVLDMNGAESFKRTASSTGSFKSKGAGSIKRNDSFDNMVKARKHDILSCMETGTEGCIVLVGAIDDIDQPIVAFVRLAEAILLPNTIEVSLPVRFIFILLTPVADLELDHHEIGRSMSTLMSNPDFHNVCYRVQEKREMLHGINEFLDDSVVLPPGDWDRKNLLPMAQMIDMRKQRRARKAGIILERNKTKDNLEPGPGRESGAAGEEEEEDRDKDEKRNPMMRTSTPFGGVIEDIKYRYLDYKSDILDGLNSQCLAATIFIYFAALSGAIAFGGLMGAKTDNNIGISETLIISSVMGVIFALFSGCPLIIIGVTGPVLLYDEALYQFTLGSLPGQFLFWRVWIGIWVFVIALLVAGFQGSSLVRHFTKFTKDIFASLVALLFIYEAFNKLFKIFRAHPLLETAHYCQHLPADCYNLHMGNDSLGLWPLPDQCSSEDLVSAYKPGDPRAAQPNTGLMSLILMFGTFFIAYFLRIFRNSQFLGRNARRALGDFGVPIAIVIMVLVDWSAGDSFTEKLSVPSGIQVTNSTARGWLIPPAGTADSPLPIWAMLAAIVPAVLLYLLLFMETHICELIMMEKTKEKKGAGLHLDIVLLSLINLMSGFLGGPWICAATVRAVSHVSALTVMSTTNVPGEAPKVVGIRDQRVSPLVVSILLGVSVALAPILKLVPFAVLFGVFLYMGVSGMNGVQFFDRVALCFMPVKHHPNVSYVQHVKTLRMVLFTVLQAGGLAVLWIVKSFPEIALAFPFFVILMIPYRYSLKFIFTDRELSALDGATAGTNLSGVRPDDEEKDFFETAAECPITPSTQAPLHRAMLNMVMAGAATVPERK